VALSKNREKIKTEDVRMAQIAQALTQHQQTT
jgi:hypothetical protein